MRHVDPREVLKRLEDRKVRGDHVDDRLISEVKKPGDLFLLTLQDEDSFLSLIWQVAPATRLLTPRGQSRTLRDVADRMIENSWTFSSLTSPVGFPADQHDPNHFKDFKNIDDDFDFTKFDMIAIVPSVDNEQKESPRGTFYIYDGVHRSLVFAHRLLTKRDLYRPIEALLLTPRRV